jgi:hypothetical protein
MSQELRRRVAAQARKLDEEYDLLERMLDTPLTDDVEHPHVRVVLSQAKRVRRESTLLVKGLAQLRDNLQPQEAQGNE